MRSWAGKVVKAFREAFEAKNGGNRTKKTEGGEKGLNQSCGGPGERVRG